MNDSDKLRIEELKQLCEKATWEEEWKDIPGSKHYQASNFGNIRTTIRRGNHKNKTSTEWRLVKQCARKGTGRKSVGVPNENGNYVTRQVSRLIMEAFRGPCPKGKEVAHLNGKAWDNRLCNLDYVTHKENEAHKREHGTAPIGENNGQSILQGWQVEEIRYLSSKSIPRHKIASLFDIKAKLVDEVLRPNRRWTHIPNRTAIPWLIELVERLQFDIDFISSGPPQYKLQQIISLQEKQIAVMKEALEEIEMQRDVTVSNSTSIKYYHDTKATQIARETLTQIAEMEEGK